ncbi:MAG: hypothetical protein EOS27_15465 [Mesorhizobium sp.]|nr:MAG: hypothetical protein EOS27_15465 [Mesorhizobium sp.]
MHRGRPSLLAILHRPPLSCRASPSQEGRLAVISDFANFECRKRGGTTKLPISPLEGEMPGRAEGGAVPPREREVSPGTNT